MEKKLDPKKLVMAALLVLLATVCFWIAGPKVSSPAFYEKTIASINDKTQTVLKLTASSSLASAGLSTLPGDAATPIAEKLADFSEYFILILCVLYAEKFLLTVMGMGAVRVFLPVALLAAAADQLWHRESLRRFAVKVCLISLTMFLLIPTSIGASDFIYDTYRDSIDQVVASAEELSDESSALADAAGDQGVLSGIVNAVTSAVEGIAAKAANILNRFIETLAVMIVTSCVIPLVTLLLFLWVFRQITGVDLRGELPGFRRGGKPFAGDK